MDNHQVTRKNMLMAEASNGGKRTPLFYAQSACAGSLAACFTHFIMVPLDVLKTRMQLDKVAYPNTGTAFRILWAREGWRGLTLGLGPTNWGYLTQGSFKYGLYEIFKGALPGMVGQQTAERAAFWLYLGAGMGAEAVADVFLTPFEAVRIRLVADPTYARGTWNGIRRVIQQDGLRGLYRGFVPLLMKQVPYTAVKLATFEMVEEVLYDHLPPREQLSSSQQLAITTISGFVGGVASAIVSHPADTLLTRVNNGQGMSLWKALQGTNIWAGLVPRMGMVGVLAALQLLTYDATKVLIFGLPTSQGIKKHHVADLEERK